MLPRGATGLAHIDAHDDFIRARRGHIAARLGRLLAGGRSCGRAPRLMVDSTALPRGAARQRVIPLDEIVGTVEPTPAFDARFRPATGVVRHRWERVALAHRKGIALPPITVRRSDDGYYVVDGRHRVSVARALGHHDIDAWVTEARTPTARAA